MYTLFTDFFYYNYKDETELRARSNTFGEEKCEFRKNYNLVNHFHSRFRKKALPIFPSPD